MKKTLAIASTMLILTATAAHAQFPGFGGFGPQKPPKAIVMDQSVQAPTAEVGGYRNQYYQVSTSLRYDFGSETCKLLLKVHDVKANNDMQLTIDCENDYPTLLKFVKKLTKEADQMLKAAEEDNQRKRMTSTHPGIRGRIGAEPAMPAAPQGGAPQGGPQGRPGMPPGPGGFGGGAQLAPECHFNVENGIVTWEVKYNPVMMGWGGKAQKMKDAVPFVWNFHAPDEFDKLGAAIDKAKVSPLVKQLTKDGKDMEAKYNQEHGITPQK